MSEIKVDVVSPYTGTGLQIGESGDTVTVPSGANLKVNNIDVVAVAPSTSGKVLTSDGTNWTSATPAAGGAWTVIPNGSGTFSGESALQFTGITKTTKVFLRVVIINGGFTIRYQASIDGGSNWLSTGTSYSFNKFEFYSNGTTTNLNYDNNNSTLDTMTAGGSGTIGQEFTLHDPTSTSNSKMTSSITTFDQNSGSKLSGMSLGTGSIETTSAVNAIKVFPYAGTFSGVYTVTELN